MKKIGLVFYLLLNALFVHAQSLTVKTSDLVNGEIGVPVLLMENGTSIFQYDDPKTRKMYITIFDQNNKLVVHKKDPLFKKIKYANYYSTTQESSHVEFWREMNGKAYIYMESEFKPFCVLIDIKTGIAQEEVEMENVEVYEGRNVYNGQIIKRSFVKRDRIDIVTGNRIKVNNAFVSDFKSIKKAFAENNVSSLCTFDFTVFNSSEKELQKASFDYINNEYQGGTILFCKFYNDVFYFVSKLYYYKTIGEYNSAYQNEGKGAYYFSAYDLKTKKITNIKIVEIKEEFYYGGCNWIISSDNKNAILQFDVRVNSKGGIYSQQKDYFSNFNIPIDLQTCKIGEAYSVSHVKLNEFVQQKCNQKNGYDNGMEYNLKIDKQGNAFATYVKNAYSGNGFGTKNHEIIGVLYYEVKTGKELYGSAYPYETAGGLNEKLNYKTNININNFNYLVALGGKSNYLFLNNLPGNFNLPIDKKPYSVSVLETTNSFAIEFTEKGEMKQHYLFGEPANKTENKYADFRFVFYDEKTNTYLVKIYEGPGHKNTRAAIIKVE